MESKEGQEGKKPQTPDPNTDPVAELKRRGLYDPDHGVVDFKGALDELESSKRKISNLGRELKTESQERTELQRRLAEVESRLSDEDEEKALAELDPTVKKTVKTTSNLAKKLSILEDRFLELAHGNTLEELRSECKEVLEEKPWIKRLPTRQQQVETLIPLAEALKIKRESASKEEAAKIEGAQRAVAGNRGELEGATAPVHQEVTESDVDALIAELDEKLKDPKLDRHARNRLTDQYKAKIEAISKQLA